MPRNEGHIIPQGEEFLPDRVDERVVVATRKVSTPDRTLEEDITDLGQFAGRMVENNVSRCMAGAMQNLQHLVAKADLISVLQPTRRFKRANARQAKRPALIRHTLQPEAVFFLRPLDFHAKLLCQFCGCSRMINMTMRHKNLGQGQLFALQQAHHPIQITARINHDGLARFFTPEYGAVLLKGGHGNDGVAHDFFREKRNGADYRMQKMLAEIKKRRLNWNNNKKHRVMKHF